MNALVSLDSPLMLYSIAVLSSFPLSIHLDPLSNECLSCHVPYLVICGVHRSDHEADFPCATVYISVSPLDIPIFQYHPSPPVGAWPGNWGRTPSRPICPRGDKSTTVKDTRGPCNRGPHVRGSRFGLRDKESQGHRVVGVTYQCDKCVYLC